MSYTCRIHRRASDANEIVDELCNFTPNTWVVLCYNFLVWTLHTPTTYKQHSMTQLRRGEVYFENHSLCGVLAAARWFGLGRLPRPGLWWPVSLATCTCSRQCLKHVWPWVLVHSTGTQSALNSRKNLVGLATRWFVARVYLSRMWSRRCAVPIIT